MSEKGPAGSASRPGLTPETRHRIQQMLQRGSTPGRPTQMIQRRQTDGPCPLSFNQEMIWIVDQLVAGTSTYNVPKALRMRGALNVDALRRALDTLVERHQTLRTTFVATQGEPMQIVAPAQPVDLRIVDVSACPEGEREAEAGRAIHDEAHRLFDLAHGPMLRPLLVRVGEQEHVLLLLMHHIASDGWSMGILTRELGALYGAYASGQPSPLPELPIQYTDFAQWQREHFRGETLANSLAYWQQQLAGAPPTLDLPADRPRPPVQSFRGNMVTTAIPEALAASLTALSRDEGVTPFMTLLAALNVLLSRMAGREDIVVGSPIAGRTCTEVEGLIGFFVNTLVLRTDVSGNPTFRDLLKRVKETSLEAYAHQEMPFEKLVMELQPERDMSRSPIFQVAFVLQNTPSAEPRFAGLAVTDYDVRTDTAKFDLMLNVRRVGTGLAADWRRSSDLFDEATIHRIAGQYHTLLEGIVAERGRRISHLPLLTEAERRRIVVEWNSAPAEYPRDRCVHQLFEAQAEGTPKATALSLRGENLSYGELNARANRVANALRRRGVGPDTLVGLCMERSFEMVVAILGILKAGGAYVPLDPEYPQERLALMLEDAAPPVLLTQDGLRSLLPVCDAELLCLDTDWATIAAESDEAAPCGATPESLAYVMFTSGSTGRPKGVMVPHRGIPRVAMPHGYLRLEPSETMLLLAPVSFDASVFELWGALLNGGRCVIYPDRVPIPQELGRIVREEGVTTLWLTTALFNLMVDQAPEMLTGVRRILTGGDVMSAAHARRAVELLPETRIINCYGPTETTTFATSHPLPRPLDDSDRPVPIGRPIDGTQVYILDPHRQPVPVGVYGEVYIGGDGVARGYLNRPELTAERFVGIADCGLRIGDLPAGNPQAAGRLYRTGDLARYLPDGSIEFLGRTDSQVKIRGFRIELGEIEAALSRHPGVQDAVVLAREDTPGEKRLVAYVVGIADCGLRIAESGRPEPQSEIPNPQSAIADLRAFLKQTLPEYMVPSAFVLMDALPVGPSGKVDRKALPRPDWAEQAGAEGGYVEPADPIEEALAALWADLMGLPRVGANDDFFALGGHSLLATQVVSRVRDAFRVDVPLRALFEQPTVAGFAAAVTELLLAQAPEGRLDEMFEAIDEPASVPDVTTGMEEIRA